MQVPKFTHSFTKISNIMKVTFFTIILTLIILSSNCAFSQSADLYTQKEKVFRLALKYNDFTVARTALYDMIILKPDLTTLKDSLAILYFNIGAYPECILLSKEILEKTPNNPTILEIKAISEQSVGLIKESLADYEKLYSTNKNVYHLYQIAALQYELKRFGECETSISQLLVDKEIDDKTISIAAGEKKSQKVALKAAIHNMRGVLALETGKTDIAKSNFDEALKITPDFELAKNNKLMLEQKNAPVQKPKTAPK